MVLPFPGKVWDNISPVQRTEVKDVKNGFLDCHVTPHKTHNGHTHSLRMIICLLTNCLPIWKINSFTRHYWVKKSSDTLFAGTKLLQLVLNNVSLKKKRLSLNSWYCFTFTHVHFQWFKILYLLLWNICETHNEI